MNLKRSDRAVPLFFPGLLAALLMLLALSGAEAAATLGLFEAVEDADGVTVRWSTTESANHAGFILMRADSLDGPRVRLNDDLIVSTETDELGVSYYEWLDRTDGGAAAYYWLHAVSSYGTIESHGPFGAAMPMRPTAISLAGFDAQGSAAAPLLPLLALATLVLLLVQRRTPRRLPVSIRR